MALVRSVIDAFRGKTTNRWAVKDGVTIFRGAFVAFDTTSGTITNMADVATLVPLGFAMGRDESTLGDSSPGVGVPRPALDIAQDGGIIQRVHITLTNILKVTCRSTLPTLTGSTRKGDNRCPVSSIRYSPVMH